MSDCGVCLTGGDPDSCSENDFVNKRIVKARKDHRCQECSRRIEAGTTYEKTAGVNGSDFWTAKTCLICAEIAEAFYCEGRWFGTLWDDMHEVILNLNTSCFEKLQTPEAKADLQRRWMKRKGLTAA